MKKSFDPRSKSTVQRTNYPPFIDDNMRARKKGDDPNSHALWQIVSIKEEGIALSGPGPCRSYQIVEHDTFDKDWDVIWCRSPSGNENQTCHMKFSTTGGACAFCGRDYQWNLQRMQ